MPLVYCDNSIVDYNQPDGLIIPVKPKTVQSQTSQQVVGALRPGACRERASELRRANGDLSTILGPAAFGNKPRAATAGISLARSSPRGPLESSLAKPADDEDDSSPLPMLPTPPSTASTADFRQMVRLNGLPQLTARRPGNLGGTPRAATLAGSSSAREMRLHPGKPKPIQLRKAKSARGQQKHAEKPTRKEDARGQRRIQAARDNASREEPEKDMLVRSEYTGIARNLGEWAVEPKGYLGEMQGLQQMQTEFDLDRMRTAELMAHINQKHKSMKEYEQMQNGEGYWDQNGIWKPMPFIAAIRKYAWKEAAQLLKWSQVGAMKRREYEESDEYKSKTAKQRLQGQADQNYERPDYAVDTDQNGNTALHHSLAPFQAVMSFKRGAKQSNSWHPRGTKGAVATRHRPPPELLTALMTANPGAIGQRNRNGLTPLHFALGCTTTGARPRPRPILRLREFSFF